MVPTLDIDLTRVKVKRFAYRTGHVVNGFGIPYDNGSDLDKLHSALAEWSTSQQRPDNHECFDLSHNETGEHIVSLQFSDWTCYVGSSIRQQRVFA